MTGLTIFTQNCLKAQEFVDLYIIYRLSNQNFGNKVEQKRVANRLSAACSADKQSRQWLSLNAKNLYVFGKGGSSVWKNSHFQHHLDVAKLLPSERVLDLFVYRTRLEDAMPVFARTPRKEFLLFQMLEWCVAAVIGHMKKFRDSRTPHLIGLVCEKIVEYQIQSTGTIFNWMKEKKFWSKCVEFKNTQAVPASSTSSTRKDPSCEKLAEKQNADK